MNTFSIVSALWLSAFKSEIQYRANFLIMVTMGLVFQGTGFIFIWVVLNRFVAVGGWTLGEIAFLYGLRLIVHALNGFFSGALFSVEYQVRQGSFDRFLVRPLAPLLQLMAQQPPSSALGDLIGGIGLFVAATTLITIHWTPGALIYLVLAIIGGSLIELAMRLLCSALAFRFLTANAPMFLLDNIFSNFGNYPLSIFGNVLSFLLTFGLPLAFLAYFPAVVLLRRTGELQVHPAFAYGAPLAGVFWLVVAVLVFQHELRYYQSAGH